MATLLGRVARLAQVVPEVLERNLLVVALDGEDFLQDALDTLACMCCEGTVGYGKYNDKIFLDCNVETNSGKNADGNGYDKYGKCGYGYGK